MAADTTFDELAERRETAVIIVAAGRGERAGQGNGPKQYRQIGGRAVIAHTIEAFLALPAIGRVVAVNFRGLPDAARGADWRASLIALSDSGEERYTPLWNSGSNSITLAANENHVYLSVAGTPDSR